MGTKGGDRKHDLSATIYYPGARVQGEKEPENYRNHPVEMCHTMAVTNK